MNKNMINFLRHTKVLISFVNCYHITTSQPFFWRSPWLNCWTCLSGPESVNQILNGKDCNHIIRLWKVIFEALQRGKLDVSEEWLQKEKTNFLECEVFAESIKKRESTIFYIFLENISTLLNIYDEFEIEIRNGVFWFNGLCFRKTIWIWFKFS